MSDHESPGILTGGRWVVTARGVRVWMPDAEITQQRADVHSLVACPTCHARVDQLCRTRTGRHRLAHATRLVPKRCICGAKVAAARIYCDECRDAAQKAVKAAYRARQPVEPRLCPCGVEVERPRLLCDPCREVRRQETYRRREQRTPTRARRRAERDAA